MSTLVAPRVPLVALLAGPHFITGSVIGFIGAVGITCGAFAFFEGSLPTWRAIRLMFLANIVTTGIGLCVAVALITPLALFALLLICALTFSPAQHLCVLEQVPWLTRLGPHTLALICSLLFLASYILFYGAAGTHNANPTLYWVLKLAAIYPALAISMGMTTLWETWLVSRWAGVSRPAGPCYPAVLRANLVTLVVLMGAAAAMALPKRLASPDFLLYNNAAPLTACCGGYVDLVPYGVAGAGL
jgi:hypothetical protein